ncbi:MAG: ATP synthase F1 subunit epsilon [bacterium]|nr:ATP synthase F1 subunit epsilon [Candidatus Binatota bacterium]
MNLRLRIVTPERVLADTEVSELTAPGVAGEFGVLPEHVTFLGGLDTGVLSYTDAKGDNHELVVSGGYAEVVGDIVTVLADSAQPAGEIDAEAAARDRDQAQATLDDPAADTAATEAALLALKLAETRLGVS